MNLLELIATYRKLVKSEGPPRALKFLNDSGVHPEVRKAIVAIDEVRLCACGQFFVSDSQFAVCQERELERAKHR